MISSLRGTVGWVGQGTIEVVVADVGYEVHVSTGLAAVASVGRETRLCVHTVVREDAITLFGFETADERASFRQLITVTGVGPKLALAVLSSFSVDGLKRAIAAGDVDALTAVPGVGKRGAQRIVMELKDKMGLPFATDRTGALAEASDALSHLGYSTVEVRDALERIPADEATPVEDLVKAALKELART